ncbi:hypothetical protein [Fluviicola sp.]|uniref:hypothetical protein n=1 Tax=Fluviicola sp. TaxID=1917219 RepID=UPI003D2B9D4C
MKYMLSFEEFETQTRMLVEVAKWDNAKKKKIDKAFVSFSKGEEFEPDYLYDDIETIFDAHGIKYSQKEVEDVVKKCVLDIPINNPRRALLKCVLGHYGIDIEDVDK